MVNLRRSNIGSLAVDFGTFAQRFQAKRKEKSGSPLDFLRKDANLQAMRERADQSSTFTESLQLRHRAVPCPTTPDYTVEWWPPSDP